jgi:hypothetical protein
MVCISIAVEASPNGGVHGTFFLVWGLVDGHILDTVPRRGVLACILPVSPRHRALGLLLHHRLDERAQLLVGAAPLGRRLLWEPAEQSCSGGDFLACLGEAWGTLVIFEDPLVYVVGGDACALHPRRIQSLSQVWRAPILSGGTPPRAPSAAPSAARTARVVGIGSPPRPYC